MTPDGKQVSAHQGLCTKQTEYNILFVIIKKQLPEKILPTVPCVYSRLLNIMVGLEKWQTKKKSLQLDFLLVLRRLFKRIEIWKHVTGGHFSN